MNLLRDGVHVDPVVKDAAFVPEWNGVLAGAGLRVADQEAAGDARPEKTLRLCPGNPAVKPFGWIN
jgi:hypothetical protein